MIIERGVKMGTDWEELKRKLLTKQELEELDLKLNKEIKRIREKEEFILDLEDGYEMVITLED